MLRSAGDVMRLLMMVAGGLGLAGIGMAQMADRLTAATPAKAAAATAAPSTSGSRTVNIGRDQRGHFATDAKIDGQRIGVMVDTGASVLALNESSAARFGLRPNPSQYIAKVTTANGIVKGAPTRIAMIDVGGIIVRDVEALVLPDTALSENLLGLSFLSRLRRYEFAGGTLVLEQ
jgi:aspartyl protease family protein